MRSRRLGTAIQWRVWFHQTVDICFLRSISKNISPIPQMQEKFESLGPAVILIGI